MAQFFTLLTEIGQAKLANAIALGQQLEITELAVGDGGGSLPEPQGDEEQLINELRRAAINTSHVDGDNPNWIVVEQVIPPDVGGWTIREVGIVDSAGDLIGYGNYPETYKPVLEEGSSRTQTVRFVLEVSDTAAVTLKVDPSVVLATREYVDTERAEHEQDPEAHSADQVTIVTPIPQAPDAETVQQALVALGEFATDGFQNIAVFDTPDTTNWPVPQELQDGLRKANVTVIAAGGGGARIDASAGGGGGGGGIAHGIYDLTGVTSVSVTVGLGGAGRTGSDGAGSAGGSSSFGAFCSATGGGGATTSGSGGVAGTATGGAINTSIGGGDASFASPGSSSNIGAGAGAGGAGSRNGTGNAAGRDGYAPGSGGEGGRYAADGGNGAKGKVIVRW